MDDLFHCSRFYSSDGMIKYETYLQKKWAQERTKKNIIPVITLVDISAGSFLMGSIDGVDEGPVHTVSISAFKMSATEITEGQYYARSDRRSIPIVNISWHYAANFCNKISKRDLLEPCYNDSTWGCDFSKNGYRLPTEAEWEYACRAKSTTLFSSDDDESVLGKTAWFLLNSDKRIHPVGQKKPNAWGLYDMQGNVWEWCNDWYGPYSAYGNTDPPGALNGQGRVLRGGACNHPAFDCRSALRTYGNPKYGGMFIGFRIVRRQVNP